ncbi:pyrroline-5-carboxylate reductase family protein [Opitutus terrae]|uniref:NADP oxidoreductase coenzyme F420-dependent n=1 Tax=Opitutus terrae (strain DSM 11246 / JCM 15787 / PB90-1) TaxID=452637 RepID=B1ZZZ8_OPITP|nr:NAD(P)-binding domain-containing protein [Opitutus terrae]ACB77334.1 NADP oxidoreductase coenzyme F420-dependent [Opitutus terrae PB90-1]
MSAPSIGFIGGGRVARIFLLGWTRAQKLPARIVVADPNADALTQLRAQFPAIETTTDLTAAAAQGVVFLATHPPVLADAAGRAAAALKPTAILVSLAPKFPIAKLSTLLGGFARIARSNPNAPSVVGAGFNPLAFGSALTAADRDTVRALFAPLGDSPEVAEEKIEAYAVFTAMGPTYLWFQMQALRELAVTFGLTPAEADVGLKRMTCGAARTLVDSGLAPTDVMDLVPVKPLAEMEPQVLELYRTRLPALFQKIKP